MLGPAKACQPKFDQQLKSLAADAQRFYLDETVNRIPIKMPTEKKRAGRIQWRSGAYASAALAECIISEPGSDPPDGTVRRLVFFQTNIEHTGKWLDKQLRARAPDLAGPC